MEEEERADMKSIINALKKEGKRAPPELHRSRTGNWRLLQVDSAAPRSAWTFSFFLLQSFIVNFKYTVCLVVARK